jgi:hypothetical protein
MTPDDDQNPPGDDRKAPGNDQKPRDDQKVPGANGDPPALSEKAIDQVFEGLQSAPSAAAASTTVASAVHSLSSVLTPGAAAAPVDPLSAIWRALDDMTIPPQHVEQLTPLFKAIGLNLKDDAVADPDDAKVSRRFTSAVGHGTEIAVLHLPGAILRMPKAVGVFRHSLSNIWNRHGRVISDTDWVQLGIRKSLQTDPPADRSWMWVPWGDLETVFSGNVTIEDALSLRALLAKKNGAAAPVPARTLDDDIKDIVDILTRQALVTKAYFEDLVNKADWTDLLKARVQGALGGNPAKDAQALVNILRAANLYSANHLTRKGDTFLGWVLLSELDGLGDPDGATLAKIIVDRGLVQQKEGLDKAKARLGGGD